MRPIIKTDTDWGSVPTIDGDIKTALPNPSDPTAPTATAEQQSAAAGATADLQTTLLPPPPPPNACVQGDSFTAAFYTWLLKLRSRVGGAIATPINDDTLILDDDSAPIDPQARELIKALQIEQPEPTRIIIPPNEFDIYGARPAGIQEVLRQTDIWEPAPRQLIVPSLELWDSPRTGAWLSQDKPVFHKESGRGLQVDIVNPTYPWQDQIGAITVRGTGPTDPNWVTYRDGIKQYQFSVNDEVWTNFHIVHDYLPGSDLYIHAHWSYTAASMTSGSVTWGFEVTAAKGHQQESFAATVTPTVTQTAVVSGSGGQYMHHIAEIQLSSNSPSASQINNSRIEPDTLLLVRCFLSANTLNGTPEPFLHFCDLHYQSTGIGTKQKAPNFYI